MFTDCFNRIFDCSIRVSRCFCKLIGRAQQTFGRGCQAGPYQACLLAVSHVSAILVSDYSCFMPVHSL